MGHAGVPQAIREEEAASVKISERPEEVDNDDFRLSKATQDPGSARMRDARFLI